jgi:elongation factor Ts
MARPKRSCASSSGRRRARPPAASPPRASWRSSMSPPMASSVPSSRVNCETDFVAKNDDFLRLAQRLCRPRRQQNPADVAALSALPMGEGTVESTRTALVGKIGENMSIRRFVRVEAKGRLALLHPWRRQDRRPARLRGRRRRATGQGSRDAHRRSKPKALDASGVDAGLIDSRTPHCHREGARSRQARSDARKDRRRLGAEVPEGGHPAGPGLRQGRGRQADDRATAQGQGASVAGFTLYIVGEGIEKKVTDFAAEVAEQAAAAAASSLSSKEPKHVRRLQAHPAQALRRSPHGRRRLWHQSRTWSPASSPRSPRSRVSACRSAW